MFNPNLYSIRWKRKNPSAEELSKYTLENYPEYNTVVNYVKDVLLRKMLADPNGVVAVKLKQMPEQTNELLQPVLQIFGSSCVWNYDYEHYLIFIDTTQEKTNNGNTITWFNFEYFDANQWVKFSAYLNTSNNQLTIEEKDSYFYNFGEIPVWHLKGIPEAKDNGNTVFKSFFHAAVPFWNDAITHESDVKASFILHMHPKRYEIAEACNYSFNGSMPCRAGKIKYEDGRSMDCPKCDGTGYRTLGGPFGEIKIPKEKLTEGDQPLGIEPFGYITVPIDATKLLEERAENQRKLGMWAINMEVEDNVGENQSGVAKVIDRQAQFDTLFNIATVIFDTHLQNAYYFFNKYMFSVADNSMGKNSDANLPEINKPTNFDIVSTTELVNNYKAAKDSGLDPNFLQMKQIEISTRDLTTNPDLKAFTNLMLDLDPLPGQDPETVSLNVQRLFARQLDAVIHFNLKRFLERAVYENPDFINKRREEQIKIIEAYGEEMVKDNKPKIDPTMMDPAYAQPGLKKPVNGQPVNA